MATDTKQRQAAKAFVKDWHGKGYEKGETARFWMDLLGRVFGITNPAQFIQFEIPVKTILKEKGSDFIDGYIPSTKVLIEQKGSKVDLGAKYRQSDGSELTPYQQARRYAAGLPQSQYPRWIVACNFTTFEVHDMEHPNDAPELIQLADLEKEYTRLSLLVDDTNIHLKKELEVSIQAGEIVGVLYDKILAQYKDPSNLDSQKSLNKLCVRLVFCLYAEDAGIFGTKDMFHDYMQQFDAGEFREKLIKLFRILDQKPEERDPYEDEKLLAFPYVNGGMFAGDIEIPRITDEIRTLILQRASDDFDWSQISPTIFGAVFESTLNPETRRAGGMHYTSIENIHKVIDPLFLDCLKVELAEIKATSIAKAKRDKALAFQDKLAGLQFLDPACGSGNFLTESYTSLRRLENEALRIIYGSDRVIGEFADPIKVSINQFYGIEINDFACSVAQTALWIAEAQMMQETDEIVGFNLDPLPLKAYGNIREGNALRMDWGEWPIIDDTPSIIARNTFVYQFPEEEAGMLYEPEVRYGDLDLYTQKIEIRPGKKEPRTRRVRFDYIMGNPPFVGARWLTSDQREDVKNIFGPKWKNSGILDYVCCWYKKSFDYMNGTGCRAALVSTNSITQGEHVAAIWKPLFELGLHFDFAHRTFIWDSEASEKAHVHCVILGFSTGHSDCHRRIYDSGNVTYARNINGYLLDAPDVFIESRVRPLCDVPEIRKGNQPTDGGNLIIEKDDYDEFIKKEPAALPYIKRFFGAKEYLNNIPRYCLWLVNVPPSQLKAMPAVMDRVTKVREMRLASSDPGTHRLADTPTVFRETNNPEHAIVIPEVSSERRRYVPMSFIGKDVICSNKLQIIPNANLYEFGILESSVHMAWMRVVCGRLKSDYDYSKKIVYNNFPWPDSSITESSKLKIEQTAQAILEAREIYPTESLADLYDDTVMPPELRKAHRANDAAVLEAYGFPKDATESDIVARLFKMYRELTQ